MASCWTGQKTNAFILNCVKEIPNSINKNAPWKEGRRSRRWPGRGLRRDYLSLMAKLLTATLFATPIYTSNVTVSRSTQRAHRHVLPLLFAGLISPVVSWLGDLWRYQTLKPWNPRGRPETTPTSSRVLLQPMHVENKSDASLLQASGRWRGKKSLFLLHFAWIRLWFTTYKTRRLNEFHLIKCICCSSLYSHREISPFKINYLLTERAECFTEKL